MNLSPFATCRDCGRSGRGCSCPTVSLVGESRQEYSTREIQSTQYARYIRGLAPLTFPELVAQFARFGRMYDAGARRIGEMGEAA